MIRKPSSITWACQKEGGMSPKMNANNGFAIMELRFEFLSTFKFVQNSDVSLIKAFK